MNHTDHTAEGALAALAALKADAGIASADDTAAELARVREAREARERAAAVPKPKANTSPAPRWAGGGCGHLADTADFTAKARELREQRQAAKPAPPAKRHKSAGLTDPEDVARAVLSGPDAVAVMSRTDESRACAELLGRIHAITGNHADRIEATKWRAVAAGTYRGLAGESTDPAPVLFDAIKRYREARADGRWAR